MSTTLLLSANKDTYPGSLFSSLCRGLSEVLSHIKGMLKLRVIKLQQHGTQLEVLFFFVTDLGGETALWALRWTSPCSCSRRSWCPWKQTSTLCTAAVLVSSAWLKRKKGKILSLFFVWNALHDFIWVKDWKVFPCNQFSDDLEAIIRLKVRWIHIKNLYREDISPVT